MNVRALLDEERRWMVETLSRLWGAPFVVARGEPIAFEACSALLAFDDAGTVVGLLSYRIDRQSLEVVSLNALTPGRGAGRALLDAVVEMTAQAGLRRLWLVTTNDNTEALGFYVRRGLRLVAVHQNAVAWSRVVKPSIPEVGPSGAPVVDELELELLFDVETPPPLNWPG